MTKPRQNKTGKQADLTDSSRGIRLHKALANAGIGSRRACEQLINEHRVTVNSQVINKMPVWVDPSIDKISIDGRPVARIRKTGSKIYLMVFKPRKVICTNNDPEGRRSIIDLVPHSKRLFCIGRLDGDSTGMVILTNDGELTNSLTHPSFGVAKTYHVTIKGRLDGEDVEKLKNGIFLAMSKSKTPAKTRATKVKISSRDRDRCQLEITLREGRNREIRRMLARLGHRVTKLKRVAIGPVKLKALAPGQWRELTRDEVSALRRTAKRSQQVDN